MGEIIHREQFFLEKQLQNKMNQIMLEAAKEQEKKEEEGEKKRMTQDELEKAYFNAVYDILVTDGGASEYMRNHFITLHLTKGNEEYGPCDEYRFSGHFLFGGKYRRGKNKIDYYSEDQNKTLDKLQAKINAKLSEVYKEYRAKGLELKVYQS